MYAGARLSQDESIRLIYSFLLRHKLSKAAVADLLLLLNFHLPASVSIPSSAFLLEKAIEPDFSVATRCTFCPKCEVVVENEKCGNCGDNANSGISKENFFVLFNMESSLCQLLRMDHVKEDLQTSFQNRKKENGVLEDIVDGECYKKLQLGSYDLTCSINTDGISIFNASKKSLWPIFISVNELSYKMRRRHTMLAGLWFGHSKPSFDIFLKPFVSQCNDLGSQGIAWEFKGKQFVSKVYFPIVCADSVARCSLQGIKQFNGRYGCPWCLIPGKTFQDGKKHKWIYPPETAPRRTNSGFIAHLRTLQANVEADEDEVCYGVQAASQFLLLKNFDIVDGFVFDYMHTCLLGVVRGFTNIWFDSKNHEMDFYIGTKMKEVSTLFQRCKVPFECNRVTRDLDDMAYWKANEWKTWMLVAVPILNGILKFPYLNHFSKLVHAVCLLTADKICVDYLHLAKKLLVDFCNNVKTLYGERFCSFNVHLLLHAADCVRNWGPLWSYSLFQFEHTNGMLSKYFAGTRQICMQIVRKVILSQQVRTFGLNGFKNEMARSFFVSLSEGRRYAVNAKKFGIVTCLGPKRKYVFSSEEVTKLRQIGIADVYNGWSYKRFILNGKKYVVSNLDTSKHVNSVVKIESEPHVIFKIVIVEKSGNSFPVVFVRKLTTQPVLGLPRVMKVVRLADNTKVFEVSNINACKYICFYTMDLKMSHVSELLNCQELE